MSDRSIAWALAAIVVTGCGGNRPAPVPPCDQQCADGTALRGLRLALKSGFNRTLQGNDAGGQDATTPCLVIGSAHIHGAIETNDALGTMQVDLAYDLDSCGYLSQPDSMPAHQFRMTLSGSITEKGTLSAQPTATTSLLFRSDAMSFSGTVYDPPEPYDQASCALVFEQNGNSVAGTVCGRQAGFNF